MLGAVHGAEGPLPCQHSSSQVTGSRLGGAVGCRGGRRHKRGAASHADNRACRACPLSEVPAMSDAMGWKGLGQAESPTLNPTLEVSILQAEPQICLHHVNISSWTMTCKLHVMDRMQFTGWL